MFFNLRLCLDLFFAGAIVALFAAGAFYVYHSAATIRTLRDQLATVSVQTNDLRQANETLLTSITHVQEVQQQTNASLELIRTQAERMAIMVQNQTLRGTPSTIQRQVNQQTNGVFSRLETLSRAP